MFISVPFRLYGFYAIVSESHVIQELNFSLHSPEAVTSRSHDSVDGLHLLQEFFIITSTDYISRKNTCEQHTHHQHLRDVPFQDILKRQEEFNSVLQRNLNHPLTSTLTIVHNDTSLKSYLNNLNLKNSEKLNLVYIAEGASVRNEFLYINRYMLNKVVMILHQDNVLGEGVERINIARFKNENISYSLTRTVEEGACQGDQHSLNYTTGVHCKRGGQYGHSHDAFVFSLKQEYPIKTFDVLNFNADTLGQESKLIWFFKTILNYRVTNPCLVIHVYHQHCSNIHTRSVNKHIIDPKMGYAEFTDQIF